MINELIKALNIKKPKYFLFENVKNITAQRFEDFLRNVRYDIDKAGYKLYFKELQSSDYGTPNYRTRVWFIGYRKDIAPPFYFAPYPEKDENFKALEDILENKRDDSLIIKNENNIIDKTTIRENKIIHLGQYKDSNFESLNRVISIKGVSSTLLCTISPAIYLNNKIYKLTKKELFRIQGFLNDEINLDGLSWNQCLNLAGDGWDVNLVSKIYKQMLKNYKI